LDQLRFSVFQNIVKAEAIGVEPSPETLKTNTFDVTAQLGRKWMTSALEVFGGKNLINTMQSIAYLAVKDAIVCIDDLERRGTHLQIRDILGLISELKERKSCKIVLILNDEELDESGNEEFQKFSEKVIDASVIFAPTASDCALIALKNDEKEMQLLSRATVRLNINNIRVIKRIERFVTQLTPLFEGRDEQVVERVVQSTVLLGWVVLSVNEDLLEFLIKKRGKTTLRGGASVVLSLEEKRFDDLLERYGFSSFDDLDGVLLSGVRQGFFDVERLFKCLQREEERLRALRGQNEFSEAWKLYRESLQDNGAEIAEKIAGAFPRIAKYLQPADLNRSVILLKALGYREDAVRLVSIFVDAWSYDRRVFDIDDEERGDEITDPDVLSEFEKKLATFEDKRSLRDVMMQIPSNAAIESASDWGRAEVTLLSRATTQDFYNLYKNETGQMLGMFIRDGLRLSRWVNAELDLREVGARAEAALAMIAQESELNRLRLEYFGYTLARKDVPSV